ncbi:CRISPR-associated protein Csx28 [uncultured Bacteroides sp.]|uniref:type VI-B CRISPR accessory protein Csx28 n=1 Tax=uncultured Bacteroides sp. TaxID=162156 RepID=UPI002AAA707F|nr:CRISPR-associated protein Csx28 [uncultured Bacteroides sp.]
MNIYFESGQVMNDSLLEWAKVLADPLAIIITAFIALYWGHKYWRKQKREEGTYLQRQINYEAKINAAKAMWGLLRYISESDHEDNIFRRGELDSEGNKIHYFRSDRATLFMKELTELFYTQGHGLFIDKEIKELIFELRSQLFGWYLIALKEGQNELKIKNKEKFERIQTIRAEINKKLKKQITIY